MEISEFGVVPQCVLEKGRCVVEINPHVDLGSASRDGVFVCFVGLTPQQARGVTPFLTGEPEDDTVPGLHVFCESGD